MICKQKTEVYARVCGFFRPIQGWNRGKREEYKDRLNYRTSNEITEESARSLPTG